MKHCIALSIFCVLLLFSQTLDVKKGSVPTINGQISPGEWSDATRLKLNRNSVGDSVIVYLKHDGDSHLYIAFWAFGFEPPLLYNSGWLFLDILHNHGSAPQEDDIWLMHQHYEQWIELAESVGTGSGWQGSTVWGWDGYGVTQKELAIDYNKLGITPGYSKTIGARINFGGYNAYEAVWPDAGIYTLTPPDLWGGIRSSDNWASGAIEEDEEHYIVPRLNIVPTLIKDKAEICYQLPRESRVSITLFNILGELVIPILDKTQPDGEYNVLLDTKRLSSGVYFCKFATSDFVAVRKIIVTKK